jgi:prevent-host-death family protein
MTIYTSTQARAKLFHLIDETNQTHEPIYIKGKRSDAVILSKEDYESMQETLYLHSVPGLVKSILDASNAPPEDYISQEEFWK